MKSSPRLRQALLSYSNTTRQLEAKQQAAKQQEFYKSKISQILDSQLSKSKSAVYNSQQTIQDVNNINKTSQILNSHFVPPKIFIPKELESEMKEVQARVVQELIERKEKEQLALLLAKYAPDYATSKGSANKLLSEVTECGMVDSALYDIGNEYVKSLTPKEKNALSINDFLGFSSQKMRSSNFQSNQQQAADGSKAAQLRKEQSHKQKLVDELYNNYQKKMQMRELETVTAQQSAQINQTEQEIAQVQREIAKQKQFQQLLAERADEAKQKAQQIVEQVKNEGI